MSEMYFIDGATGARVSKFSLQRSRKKSFMTKKERGSRRKPYNLPSISAARERALAIGEDVCVRFPSGAVWRIDQKGHGVFLYAPKSAQPLKAFQ